MVKKIIQIRRSRRTVPLWLVVCFLFIFPHIGNSNPNWLSYFSEGLKPPTSPASVEASKPLRWHLSTLRPCGGEQESVGASGPNLSIGFAACKYIYIYICILSLMCLNYMSRIHVHTDPKKMVLEGVSVLCSAVTVWKISQVAGWEIPNKMDVLTWKYGKITYIWRFIAGNNDTNDDTWWHDETLLYIYIYI